MPSWPLGGDNANNDIVPGYTTDKYTVKEGDTLYDIAEVGAMQVERIWLTPPPAC